MLLTEIAADRVSRGKRLKEIQGALGLDGKGMVAALQAVTNRLGLSVKWYEKRLSTIVNGGQDLSLEDVAILEAIDPKKRSWHWVAFGVEKLGTGRAVRASGEIPMYYGEERKPNKKTPTKRVAGENGKSG